MNFLMLTLLILACYRLARLISKDLISEPLRRWVGRQASSQNKAWMLLAELLLCPYCVGVWAAMGLAFIVSHSFLEWCLYALAIAGGQSFLQEVSNHA